MNLPNDLGAFVEGSPKKNGVSSFFVRLDENHGLKYTYSMILRNQMYDSQRRAFAIGIAPEPFDLVEFTLPGKGTQYGYVTEAIPATFWDQYVDEWANGPLPGPDPRIEEPHRSNNAMLRERLEDIGLLDIAYDLHSRNWGYDKNGKPVCIDFS